MTHKDLKTLFNDWWTAYDPDNRIPKHREDAREAFYAAYEAGLSRGHAMGQELGTAIARLEAKMKDDWECPLGLPDCKKNCGNYGCGN